MLLSNNPVSFDFPEKGIPGSKQGGTPKNVKIEVHSTDYHSFEKITPEGVTKTGETATIRVIPKMHPTNENPVGERD